MGSRTCESGFSYLEILIAIVILTGAVTSMGFALESSRFADKSGGETGTADYLLQDGIAWARTLARRDPQNPSAFGVDSGETAATFDDVDDLDGLSEAAPTDLGGTTFGSDWVRDFTVESVSVANPALTVADGASSLMRLTVLVRHMGAVRVSGSVLFWRNQ